jgi:hypothetical protein
MFPFQKMTLEDWVQAMASLDPKMDGVRYFEWMGLIFVLGWIVQTGLHYHRSIIRENSSIQSDTGIKSNSSETPDVSEASNDSDLPLDPSIKDERSDVSPQSHFSEVSSD